jgi:hypothetical protein
MRPGPERPGFFNFSGRAPAGSESRDRRLGAEAVMRKGRFRPTPVVVQQGVGSFAEQSFELNGLHLARAALVEDRTDAKKRAKAITLSLLEKQNKKRIAEIDAKIEEIGAAIEQHIEGGPLLGNAKSPSVAD